MIRDEVIRFAHEAGIRIAGAMDTVDPRNVYAHELERFAALVAAHEREECARVCEQDEFSVWETGERIAAAIRARNEK